MTSFSLDTGDGARVPIRTERTEHQILSDIAALLFDMRTELQHIKKVMQQHSEGGIASVEVKTSARGVDISAKSYDYDQDGVGAQVMPAVDAYFDVMAEVQRRLRGEPTSDHDA